VGGRGGGGGGGQGLFAALSGPSSQAQQISENYTTYYEKPPNIWKMIAVTLLDTLGHTPMPSVSIKSGSGV